MSTFDPIDRRFDQLDHRFEGLDRKFDHLIDRFDAKFDNLTFHVNRMGAILIVSNVLAVLTATAITVNAT